MPGRRLDAPPEDPFAAIGCDEVVPIGSGGSSVVYRARQLAFDRLIALKVLSQPLVDERSRRRFERELALAGRLTGHPNVVTVFASGFFPDRRAYVQMEYCPGGSLADRLAGHGPFPVRDVVSIGVKIAGVLELARQDGIVHRDVKPANVLVTRFGEPALADFGIAIVSGEMTGTTQALTPVHAAPEVLESREIGSWSDQWSLGSTLHTLLAGRAPFASEEGESLLGGMLRILNDPVPAIPRSDVPDTLRSVLDRTMAKAGRDRWATPAELGEALQEVERREGWPVTALPTVEVSEARYEPLASPPAPGRPGGPVDPGSTYGAPASSPVSPAPAPPAGPGPDAPGLGVGGLGAAGLAEEGDTVHWQRGAAPSRGVAPPPSAGASVSPEAAPPGLDGPGLAPGPGLPPGPGLAPGPGPALGPGESTEHWSRPRVAPPEIRSGPRLEEPVSTRRWWYVGGGIAAAVALLVVVVAVVLSSHGSRPTAGSSTTATLPTQNPGDLVPTGVEITAETGTAVTLQWKDNATTGLTYVVIATNELTGEQGNAEPTSQTSYTASGLTPGVRYCFAVGVVEAGGAQFAPNPPCRAGASSSSSSTAPPAG